ncbi:2-polyprenyl-6-methoxyphenol hydroxylase-like FAD-dependent oxidoreductase [Bosea sp. AK1]|uniref:FAD-dependent oxidoreductase n=1 Tax=Bosea sp. AK1 TaxID=2587160 RepID=UPI00114FFC6C|nr:NAD(P)/FAD-dependent oxidoreductase [Bosea sp. AK1]TQI73051.1 2-polyprenyl-6-methoxyphenol hydroxylase-like FAD-dependent oxidoreductase [Bosea sp. AK1]
MTRRYEIAVAGCGPAGLAAALLLERAGHRVTLVERFATPQPLGSGLILQPTGLAVLRELDLAEALIARGSRLDRLYGLGAATGSVVLDVRYAALGPDAFGLGIHRGSLFEALFAAVMARGIAVETGCEIVDVENGSGGRVSLILENGRKLGPFDLAIDALGARSPLIGRALRPVHQRPLTYGAVWANAPLAAGFDPHALEQRYRRASVMVGVLPIGRRPDDKTLLASFFWSLKPADHAQWQARGLDAWKADVLRYWPETAPMLESIMAPEQLLLASYRHHTLPVPAGRGLAFIGDSAHSTSPQLGQGANMGLLDAYALASAVNEAADIAGALERYARLRRFHVRLYQAASRLFTPFYQSDSVLLPLLRDRLVPPLARLPGIDRQLALLVAGLYGDPLRALKLGPAFPTNPTLASVRA